MMVTFVSQCEKKALSRTRRVLDAFANRIGDNTWQTIITQEGLQAVKKLLRKTATKNTAVSCHWIRSRSRSELIWVVGNRGKFNQEGVVPVNYTYKEIPMDIDNYKPKKDVVYANTHYQRLDEHLFAVGYVASYLYESLIDDIEANHKKIIYFSGLLHDLGKNEPNFQKYIHDKKKHSDESDDGQHIANTNRFSFDDFPRHNELSSLIFHVLNDEVNNKKLNKIKEHINHVVFWHHAAPFRKSSEKFNSFNKLSDIYFSKTKKVTPKALYQDALELVKTVDSIAKEFDSELSSVFDFFNWQQLDDEFDEYYSLSEQTTPHYKQYLNGNTKLESKDIDIDKVRDEIGINGRNNLFRSCVITADRLVSKLNRLELKNHIADKTLRHIVDQHINPDSALTAEIEESLNSGLYDKDRNRVQSDAAKKLTRIEDIAVLSGAAGCGKTKIALEWAANKKAKKLFWICPRVQVCQGIFTELTEQYLPDSNIEIFTGEYKYTDQWDQPTEEGEELSADIIITTIDQVLNAVISHTKVDLLIDYLNAYVVFDEFHEYTNMPAFNLLFAELIKVKQLQKNHSTLLVSATPNPFFIENILDISRDTIVDVTSFNQCKYQIDFKPYDEAARDQTNPLYAAQQPSTFVISNTAKTAQLSYIFNQSNENSILFHSKYKRSDKKSLFNAVYESFKREGNHQYDILRSGPIVQASLNISAKNMVSEICSPENMLQRLGRLDRFGENNTGINVLNVAVPDSMMAGKGDGNCARFLAKNNEFQITKLWLNFLQDHLPNTSLTLADLYRLYEQFYQDNWKHKALEDDLKGAITASIKLINNKVTDPLKIKKIKSDETNAVKLSSRSLRGDNVFVQMAKCNLDDWQTPQFLNEYAYSQSINDKQPLDIITDSISKLTNDDLIHHAAKKHLRIDSTHPAAGIKEKQMTNRIKVVESAARDSDYPIFLSYTPNDLSLLGGNSSQHPHAIFYCVCENQPIGALAINLLVNQEDDNDE